MQSPSQAQSRASLSEAGPSRRRRWSIRDRLSAASSRNHLAEGESENIEVDEQLWDKNEAGFLQDALSDHGSQSPHLSSLSFSPNSLHLRSPQGTDISHRFSGSRASHDGASWTDARSMPRDEFESAGSSSRYLHSPPFNSPRRGSQASLQKLRRLPPRPVTRESYISSTESETAQNASWMTGTPSKERHFGTSHLYSRNRSVPALSAWHHEAASSGEPRSRPSSSRPLTADAIQAADADQTVIPSISSASIRHRASRNRPKRSKQTAMESFLSATSGESESESENFHGNQRGSFRQRSADVALPPPVPPKANQMVSDAQAMPPPSHQPGRTSRTHPFQYRGSSDASNHLPSNSPILSASASQNRLSTHKVAEFSSSPFSDQRRDNDRTRQPKGFLRGMRSKDMSASGVTSSGQVKEKDSGGLVEGFKKLMKKERPSPASSPDSALAQNVAAPQSSQEEEPKTTYGSEVARSFLDQSRHRGGSGSQERTLRKSPHSYPTLPFEDHLQSQSPESLDARPTSPRQLLHRSERSDDLASEVGLSTTHIATPPTQAVFTPAQHEVTAAPMNRSRQNSALAEAQDQSLFRKPSTGSVHLQLRSQGRSRRASRADSTRSKASVIEHISHEEARRRSGAEGPIVLSNGISVDDLRSESLRRDSISSHTPPSRPHRDVPAKAGRLLGISAQSSDGGHTTDDAASSSVGHSLMDQFNDSHSMRWNHPNPWEAGSRSSHASSTRHSKSQMSHFTPTTTTTTSSDTHSLFSVVPGSITSSISSYPRSEGSIRSKRSATQPTVDPLAAHFALPKVRRDSGNSATGSVSTRRRWAALFGKSGPGRSSTISSSNISRPVSVAGSTLSDAVSSTSDQSLRGTLAPSTSAPNSLSSVAQGKMPLRDVSVISQSSFSQLAELTSSRSLSGGMASADGHSIDKNNWSHARAATAAPVASLRADEYGVPALNVGPQMSSVEHAQQHLDESRLAGAGSGAAGQDHLLNPVSRDIPRKSSLNEQLLHVAAERSMLRSRMPSADSVLTRTTQAYKRPTFGLDLQPDAAAAFDSIPSPHIVKGLSSGSKATSSSDSRRSIVSNANTFGGSLHSGTDTRPTSAGDPILVAPPCSSESVSLEDGVGTFNSGISDPNVDTQVTSDDPGAETLLSRPLPADAPSSPWDEDNDAELIEEDEEYFEDARELSIPSTNYISPASRWQLGSEHTVHRVPNARFSGYREGEELSNRPEFLEDIEEHPSSPNFKELALSTESESAPHTPQDGSSFRRRSFHLNADLPYSKEHLQVSESVRRPSDCSVGSISSEVTSVPLSRHNQEDRDEILASGLVGVRHDENQGEIIDVRSFDWL
ncbi:unnamed protein product [Sympodiomycopsis kandeliae]